MNFSWLVKPRNPSPVQPLDAIQFPVLRINVGGSPVEPKRQQVVKLFDRSISVPSLGEVYTVENNK